MANPDVTDQTLESLRPLSNLRELDLNGSSVTDAGLMTIRELPKLKILRLGQTRITDEGFTRALAAKDSLQMLDLSGTSVSRETVKAWKSGKPKRKALQ